MAGDRWWEPIKEAKYRRRRSRLPRVLSEGDSWFDYPLYRNMIDFIDDTNRYAIKRLENSGDKLQDMLDRKQEIVDAVVRENPRVVLFSAGGNDLVAGDWIDRLFTQAAPHIDQQVWDALLAFFRRGYQEVIDAVDRPVVGHGYDHMNPTDKGVRIDGITITGPWVQPAMIAKGITDPVVQRQLARKIIDDFNENLLALAGTEPRFHFVDLRDTLDPDRDWPNEMHPFEYGFEQFAGKFLPILQSLV